MPPQRRSSDLLAWLLVPLLTVVALWPLSGYRLDEAFVLHRTARNVAAGHGLVYTPDEPATPGAGSPGFALLLGGLARLTGHEPPALAWVLGMLATAAAGLLLHRLLRRFLPPAAALGGALLLVSNPLLARSTGLETALSVALVVAFLLALERERPAAPAGFLLGLALWLRFDALALAAPGLAAVLATRRRGRALLVFAASAAVVAVPSAFGASASGASGFWASALWPWRGPGSAAGGGPGADLFLSGLWRLPRELAAESRAYLLWLPLLGLGLAWLVRRWPRPVGLLALWAVAYGALLELRGVPWHHLPSWAPLQLPLVAAGAAGLEALAAALERTRPAGRRLLFGAALLALLYALLLAQVESARRSPHLPLRADAHRELGTVLRCGPGERLAAREVGILGYYSGCPVLDLSGVLSPEVRALGPEEALARARPRWSVDVRPPDYVPAWSVPARGGGDVVVYVEPPLVLTD